MRLNSGARRQTLVYLTPQPFLLILISATLRGPGCALRLALIYLSFSVVSLNLIVQLFHKEEQQCNQVLNGLCVSSNPSLSTRQYSRETENYGSQEIS